MSRVFRLLLCPNNGFARLLRCFDEPIRLMITLLLHDLPLLLLLAQARLFPKSGHFLADEHALHDARLYLSTQVTRIH